MVGAGLKPAPTTGWKPAQPGHLGSTNRSARASAAHLRAGSPHAQGTSVAPWWGRVWNPPPLRAGSPRSQGTSVVQTDPHEPAQLTCGLEARTPRVPRWHHGGGEFGTRPHYGLEARAASAAHLRAGSPRTQGTSVVQTDPHEPVQLTCGLEARTPRVPRWHHGGGGCQTRPHYGLEARAPRAPR